MACTWGFPLFFLETPAISRAFRERAMLNSESHAYINCVPRRPAAPAFPLPHQPEGEYPIVHGLQLPGLGLVQLSLVSSGAESSWPGPATLSVHLAQEGSSVRADSQPPACPSALRVLLAIQFHSPWLQGSQQRAESQGSLASLDGVCDLSAGPYLFCLEARCYRAPVQIRHGRGCQPWLHLRTPGRSLINMPRRAT